jgi:major vault protein
MEDEHRRRGDLVLAQGEQALLQDGSNGNVDVIVGPYKHSPAETDVPVEWEADNGKFRRCTLAEAIKLWPFAKEGQYVVLSNPTKEDHSKHPVKAKQGATELDMGKVVNIPGPATFPLFPGQSAKVISGHILRTNQYLVVQVVNAEEARSNWADGIVKKQTAPLGEGEEVEPKKTAPKGEVTAGMAIPALVTGKLLIIKGTEVSFYIPPTGIEVIAEEPREFSSASSSRVPRDLYIRDAVSLEQLEYCILLDEDGTKEYVRGPKVVFPKPTQMFYRSTVSNSRKLRAVELNELMGLYIKVIKPYSDNGSEFSEGEEIFIKGTEQKIYWPRAEHSVIKYGKQDIHYAIAIPKGEARYVLDRNTGDVKVVEGPKMFLPDPRNEVIVRRTISPKMVSLLYPGNDEALEYNAVMAPKQTDLAKQGLKYTRSRDIPGESVFLAASPGYDSFVPDEIGGESFERKEGFTPPRTIQLNTKYDGAIRVQVWTGYAIKIVGMTGESRVVVGPATTFLGYDEVPEVFELSTGTPKTDRRCQKDVYLRVFANKVSDVVMVETADLVSVSIPLSYRVNFEGEQDKWFDVENFVKFLTDHIRSLVINTAKQHGIEAFHNNYIDILRDTILGETSAEGNGGGRPGRVFEENGMRIYDVELGEVQIGDDELGEVQIGDENIAEMLLDNQHASVRQTLELTIHRKTLDTTTELERINRQIDGAKMETTLALIENNRQAGTARAAVRLEEVNAEAVNRQAVLDADLADEKVLSEIDESRLLSKKNNNEATEAHLESLAKIDTDAISGRMKAISPDLVKVIDLASDRQFAGTLAEKMAPLAIIGGKSITDAFSNLISGTAIGKKLQNLLTSSVEEANSRETDR